MGAVEGGLALCTVWLSDIGCPVLQVEKHKQQAEMVAERQWKQEQEQ